MRELLEYIGETRYRIVKETALATAEDPIEVASRFGFIKKGEFIKKLIEKSPSEAQELLKRSLSLADQDREFALRTQSLVLLETESFLIVTALSNKEQVKRELEKKYRKQVIFVDVDTGFIYQELATLKKLGEGGKDLVRKIIDGAILEKASDIHMIPEENSVHVLYRIDGILRLRHVLSKDVRDQVYSRIKEMAGMDISEKRLPQDGGFTYVIEHKRIDVRVATVPSIYSEKITMRLLDPESIRVPIESLGITFLDEWKNLANLSNGLILVCGATGSGKTTTLYTTILNLIDYHTKKVYTIEDPVEYKLPLITQIQVNKRANLDFSQILRSLLRHDPDVIVIGEIRDAETAENALRLADTGHLVYATLHTNDIPSSITRLLDLGVDETYLKFLLRGIMVQKLVRKLCPICKGKTCEECNYEGYKGRILLTEFVKIESVDDVKNLLNGKKKYWSFRDDALEKIKRGLTDKKEVLRSGINV